MGPWSAYRVPPPVPPGLLVSDKRLETNQLHRRTLSLRDDDVAEDAPCPNVNLGRVGGLHVDSMITE